MDELISPDELREALAGPNPPTVIDVRGAETYHAGHIAGAAHIPADEIEQSLAQIPKDRPVVTY
jgi:rhodanese-related sulfurtransferase